MRILAFPDNSFLNQEPGTPEEIKEFVSKYNVKFDMMAKIEVNGRNAHPLFAYLKKAQGGFLEPLGLRHIWWNFTKFVIDKNGKAVHRTFTMLSPIPYVSDKVIELMDI